MDPSTVVTVGLVVLCIGCVAGTATFFLWFRSELAAQRRGIEADQAERRKQLEQDTAEKHAALDARLQLLVAAMNLNNTQLSEFKADVAKTYITREGVREAITHLTDRLDSGFKHLSEMNELKFKGLADQMLSLANTVSLLPHAARPRQRS
jgi:hypothetical protein